MSSKADQLGESSSFFNARRPRSERRQLIDDATGPEPPALQRDVAPPRTVPLAHLARNPFNPRHELRELQETADSLLEKGQIQPITIVTREAFLKAHPGHDAAIGAARYIVLDGNRRFGAAQLAGLEEIRVDVNDELATSAADMLEAALVANVHRQDLTPLEEAETLSSLMNVHGSLRQVARRVGKSHVWVSQRLALLELADEFKEQLKNGELTVEDARRIGKAPRARQAAVAEQIKAERERRAGDAAPDHAVDGVDTGGGANGRPVRHRAGRSRGGNGVNTSSVDWRDTHAVAAFLRERLEPEVLEELVALLAAGAV